MAWTPDNSGSAAMPHGAGTRAESDEIEADAGEDPTLAPIDAPPEVTAQTLGEYLRGWYGRVRAGDAGVLPVVVALALVTILFSILNNRFLIPFNLVNLFEQSAVFIVLAMAEGFVLLLGEIDLSVGYVAAIGGAAAAILVQPTYNLPWWVAIGVALALAAFIGMVQGLIITQLRLPSFVVTLAGYLGLTGVLLLLLGNAGEAPLTSTQIDGQVFIHGLVNSSGDATIGWVALVGVVAIFGTILWLRDSNRRRSGLVAPPIGLTLLKIAFIAIAGFAVVYICNMDRSFSKSPVVGIPWVIPLVLVVLLGWSVLLEQTAFGRHVYAVGGNAEAARRAGIDVSRVRVVCFVLCSMTAALGGIIYASQLGAMTTNINGGQYVLYAVAAAVIGGTSLFGGRGRAIHGLLGGLVIGAINNGMFLLGFQLQWQLIATGLVLLAAVTIDALSRRGATAGTAART
jgi:D-xylose transport system permease protein